MELSSLHFVACGLHFALALAVLVVFYALPQNEGKGVVPVFRSAPDPDSLSSSNAMVYDVTTAQVGQLSLPVLLCLFACITAISHLVSGLGERGSAGSTYGAGNSIRWLEYGISAPIMVVIIASLSGVRMVTELTLMAVATAVVMYFGRLVERDASLTDKMLHTAAGWYLYIPVWVLLGYTFFTHIPDARNASRSTDDPDAGQPPAWLWAIFVAEAVLFSLFGVLQISSQFGHVPAPGIGAERAYIGLSFVSKALLILIAMFGLAAAPSTDTK